MIGMVYPWTHVLKVCNCHLIYVYGDRLGHAEPKIVNRLLSKETVGLKGTCLFSKRIKSAQEQTRRTCKCNTSQLIDCTGFRGLKNMPLYMLCQFICEDCFIVFKQWNNGTSQRKEDVLRTFEACVSQLINRLHTQWCRCLLKYVCLCVYKCRKSEAQRTNDGWGAESHDW